MMLELDAKPEEEIYFLIKYTSNSSQQQIISIKSANSFVTKFHFTDVHVSVEHITANNSVNKSTRYRLFIVK